MTIAAEGLEAGRTIEALPVGRLSETINDNLSKVIGWPYQLRSGIWLTLDGNTSDAFATVVCMGESPLQSATGAISSDRVAAVIETSESLDLDAFRPAYCPYRFC